jgi:hypothetical protein
MENTVFDHFYSQRFWGFGFETQRFWGGVALVQRFKTLKPLHKAQRCDLEFGRHVDRFWVGLWHVDHHVDHVDQRSY